MKKILCFIVVVVIICVILVILNNSNKSNVVPGINVNNEDSLNSEQKINNTNLDTNINDIESGNTYESSVIEPDKKILYFYKDGFVGFLLDGKWYASQDVQLKDIFDNEYYTVYTEKFEKAKANKVELFVSERNGWF